MSWFNINSSHLVLSLAGAFALSLDVLWKNNQLQCLKKSFQDKQSAKSNKFKFLVWDCLILRSDDHVAQLSKQAPAIFKIVSVIPALDA